MPSVEDKQLLYLPLERAWRIAKNSQDLVPRLMPQVFSSIDLVQGDGSVGSVYEITMGPGVPGRRGKKVKERVDMLDDDTHTLTHTTLEGGDPRYSSFSSSINYEPGPYPDSTIRTWTARYTVSPGSNAAPPEEMLQLTHKITEAIHSYAADNPDYCAY